MLKRLEILEQSVVEEAKPPATVVANQISEPTAPRGFEPLIGLLLLALQALGARSVAFLGHALPLVCIALGFVLAWRVMPEPSILQLVGLGIFAVFSLVMVMVKKV